MNEIIKISDETLFSLINNKGYGIANKDISLVEILIIGNESGTGGHKSETKYIESTILSQKDKGIVKDALQISPFLQFINRLRIHLNDDLNEKWFLTQKDLCSSDYKRIITESWADKNIHLIDIRPLPRPTESVWNYSFSKTQYIKSFNFEDGEYELEIQNLFKNRINFLAEFITRLPNLKLILAPGAPQMKMRFLKKVFPELHIKEIQGQTSRRVKGKEIKNTFYSAAIIRNGEPIQLFISNFFNNQNGIGLDGLKELAGLITNN